MSNLKCLVFGSVYLCLFCFISCHNGSYSPISVYYEKSVYKCDSLNLIWFLEDTSKYSVSIQGGDGIYSVTCDKPNIVQIKMISGTDIQVQPLAVGDAVITIRDQSNNVTTIQVHVDYQKSEIKIIGTDLSIAGNLTDEETETIRNEALQTIPVKAGGGYLLIYTAQSKGTAIIYPELFGSNSIESSFERASIKTMSLNGEEINLPVIYITINNEKRTFILNPQLPALGEDLTSKFKVKYPKLEMLYTSQTIKPVIYG